MMNKRYIDFVPVQTAPKSSTKLISSTPVKHVETFSVRKATITKPLSMSAKVPKTAPAYVQPPIKSAPKPVAKPAVKSTPKPAVKPAPKPAPIPTPKFINTEKIDKRPLSDSVAPKKPSVSTSGAKSQAKSAVLIDQPKKKSKIGLIIAIILTIILGAAAGALAFLVLPK